VFAQILATDGSEFQLAGEVAWALLRPVATAAAGQAGLDLQLDVERVLSGRVEPQRKDEGFESNAVAKRIARG